jgi:diadenosine tetraphosphatase ApaH/serine/threonine PP2A family protein phosphatase
MQRALLSDIHGNIEALEAVLQDIQSLGISEIYCLGDVIGYGPNPCECLDHVLKMDVCILGNHDQAAMFDPDGFNPIALRAIYWTRRELDENRGNPAAMHRRWDFLGELPSRRQEDSLLFVHGSPRDPTNEYVFPEHACDDRRMKNLFRRIDKYCFQGHTHIPGIFTESGEFLSPEDCGHRFTLGKQKLMCNVGSVGQPRDGDPRGCYVVLHDHEIEFRRVEYAFEETIAKIYQIPELENMLGDRLRGGR